MTKIEIITETAEFYDVNPVERRAIGEDNYNCRYRMKDGRECALGRCCLDSRKFDCLFDGESILEAHLVGPEFESLDHYLKPEYRGHDPRFWQEIQSFHDTLRYWTKDGLSKLGIEVYKGLLDKYAIKD